MTDPASEVITSGDGRPLTYRHVQEFYRTCVNLSWPISGRFTKIKKDDNTKYALTCYFKTTVCDTSETIRTSRTYLIDVKETKVKAERDILAVYPTSPLQPVNEIAIAISEDGLSTAVLKETDVSKRQLLELWYHTRQRITYIVDDIEQHGPINVDPHFYSMEWCPFGDQRKLLYICQPKKRKHLGFFKQQVNCLKNMVDDKLRFEDWGEGLTGIEHTVVGIIDTRGQIKISTFELAEHSLRDSHWIDEKHMVSVAVLEQPMRHGMAYCNNNPSKLIIHDFESVKWELNIPGHNLFEPRVSNSGRLLVYLMTTNFGPHTQPVTMHLCDTAFQTTQIIVEDDFITNLPVKCFSKDDLFIVYVSNCYVHQEISVLHVMSKRRRDLKYFSEGIQILSVQHDLILAVATGLNVMPTPFVASFQQLDGTTCAQKSWHNLIDEYNVMDHLDIEILRVPTPMPRTFTSGLLVSPVLEKLYANTSVTRDPPNKLDMPTVVLIHGGPHANYTNTYYPIVRFYALLGIKVLLVNYRGSAGVDDNYLRNLIGQIGIMDLEDCTTVVRYFVQKELINPSLLAVSGGSYGGFLACHLCCDNEFRYTSAVLRNPVTDLTSVVGTTDIPAWVSNAVFRREKFDFRWVPNQEELAKLYDRSPLRRFNETNVPTLVMLGSEDRRVRMFQGERWIDLLKVRGVDTKCKIYQDKHSLDKAESAIDSAICGALWILDHLTYK